MGCKGRGDAKTGPGGLLLPASLSPLSHLLMLCHSFLDESPGFQVGVTLQSGRAVAGPALCPFCPMMMCFSWAAFCLPPLHKAVLG